MNGIYKVLFNNFVIAIDYFSIEYVKQNDNKNGVKFIKIK